MKTVDETPKCSVTFQIEPFRRPFLLIILFSAILFFVYLLTILWPNLVYLYNGWKFAYCVVYASNL